MVGQQTRLEQSPLDEQPSLGEQPLLGEQATFIGDESRLHLHYGPIDLIISVDGPTQARRSAFAAASKRFDGLLDELVQELSVLRLPVQAEVPALAGSVAKRMMAAAWPYRNQDQDQVQVTPMAAVAGAVADEIGAAISNSDRSNELTRWMVNNGGDIAFWLADGQNYRVGLVPNLGHGEHQGKGPLRTLTITADLSTADMKVGGIATSGWHGRSFSLGIADSVTVLAEDAATADVAATLTANTVDLPGHPAIKRSPACELDFDSDLGDRLVTVAVGNLGASDVSQALGAGLTFAEELVSNGTIVGAYLHLADSVVSTVAGSAVAGSISVLPRHQGELADVRI